MTTPPTPTSPTPPGDQTSPPEQPPAREAFKALEAHVAEVLPDLYEQLRVIASRYMNHERKDHTLQATEVVHEAFVRLAGWDKALEVRDREQFLAAAAAVIRRVLVDHARKRNADKRGGGHVARLGEHDAPGSTEQGATTVAGLLELDGALERLRQLNERAARIVELRFFAGMTVEQVGAVLGVSARTVADDWRFARAWLRREIGEAIAGDHAD